MKRIWFVALIMVQVIWPTLASATTKPPTSTFATTKSPTFTSESQSQFTEGNFHSFTVKVATSSTAILRSSGAIPVGLTFVANGDGVTATLAGIPSIGSAGTYPVNFIAVDREGHTATQSAQIVVTPYSASSPQLTSLVIDAASPASPASVTLTGTNLKDATSVHFGSVSAKFNFNANGSIIAVVPPGTNGTVDVTVTTPEGTTPLSIDDQYAYRVAPQPPVITTAVPQGLGVLVSWTANATADQVTGYILTAVVAPFDGKAPAECLPTAVKVPANATMQLLTSGVCSGVPYALTLVAANTWGSSASTTYHDVVVPLGAQAPSAPLITATYPRSQALAITWAAPTNLGGTPLISYDLVATPVTGASPTKKFSVSGSSTSTRLDGLVNKIRYNLSLVARNSQGSSSSATAVATPSATAVASIPDSLRVVPDGHGGLRVDWTAPVDTGSGALSSYVLTYSTAQMPGSIKRSIAVKTVTVSFGVKRTSTVLTGLTATNYYIVSVRARTSVGLGKTLTTSSAVTPTVKLDPNTQVLTSGQMENLLGQRVDSAKDGHIFTWPAGTVFAKALTPGMIIIGSAGPKDPEGLLAIVQSVSTRNSAKVIEVDTTPATLGEAFRTMSFSFSSDPPLTLPFNYAHDDFSVTGQVVLSASVWLSFSFNCTATAFGICYQWAAAGEAGASMNASENLVATLNGSVTIPITSIDLGTEVFFVGPVPVTLSQSLDLNLILSSTGVTLTSSASMGVMGKTDWSSSSGFSHSHSSNFTTTNDIGYARTNSTSSAALQVAFSVCMYSSILCGDVHVNDVLTGVINIDAAPYFSLCPSITIGAGFAVNIDLIVVSWSASGDITIATIPSSSLGGCWYTTNPPATLTLVPSSPTVSIGVGVGTITANRSDAKPAISSWTLLNGLPGDSISATGVLTTVAPGSRTLLVKDTDTNVPVAFPASTAVTVGTTHAFGPPTNIAVALLGYPSIPNHTLVFTAQVSWDAPLSTGGFPIAVYAVTVNGVTTYTTDTYLLLPVSLFQSSYSVQVTAVNSQYVASPTASINHWVGSQIG